jgi:signal transduction histidine kinase
MKSSKQIQVIIISALVLLGLIVIQLSMFVSDYKNTKTIYKQTLHKAVLEGINVFEKKTKSFEVIVFSDRPILKEIEVFGTNLEQENSMFKDSIPDTFLLEIGGELNQTEKENNEEMKKVKKLHFPSKYIHQKISIPIHFNKSMTYSNINEILQILEEEIQKALIKHHISDSFEYLFEYQKRDSFGKLQKSDSIYSANWKDQLNSQQEPPFLLSISLDKIGDLNSVIVTIKVPEYSEQIYLKQSLLWKGIAGLFIVLVFISYTAFSIITFLKQKKIVKMKTDFVDWVTHELKTPVFAIGLASEAVLKDSESLQPRMLQFFKICRNEIVYLGLMMEKYLDFQILKKEVQTIEKETVDLNDILNNIVELMNLSQNRNNCKIHCKFEKPNAFIYGNFILLKNCFYNILDNAVKYSENEPFIHISTFEDEKNIIVKIQDNGIGMKEKEIREIFKPYYRIHGKFNKTNGLGLGLTYVQKIIQLHQAIVEVKSEEKKGTLFTIYFLKI